MKISLVPPALDDTIARIGLDRKVLRLGRRGEGRAKGGSQRESGDAEFTRELLINNSNTVLHLGKAGLQAGLSDRMWPHAKGCTVLQANPARDNYAGH